MGACSKLRRCVLYSLLSLIRSLVLTISLSSAPRQLGNSSFVEKRHRPHAQALQDPSRTHDVSRLDPHLGVAQGVGGWR